MPAESSPRLHSVASRERRTDRAVWLLVALLACCVLAACNQIETKVVVQSSPESIPSEIAGARWPENKLPVHYCLDPDGGFLSADDVLQLIARAFDAWGVAAASDGICDGAVAPANGRNEFSWAQLSQKGAELSEAGKTNLRYRLPEGGIAQIIEADIQIDSNAPKSRRNADCLYTTLLHETGHFLGLHHLSSSAVMSPVVTECIQVLTPEDQQALVALY